MQEIIGFLNSLLGIDQDSLSIGHMAVRAVFVYIIGLILVRIGNKRFLSRFTAYDFILSIMLGSILSRAITDSSPFYSTLVAAFMLVVFHWGLSSVAFNFRGFGKLIKGTSYLLIQDGEIQWANMEEASISRRDLEEALRTDMKTASLEDIREARLERNGRISFISKGPET